MILNQWAIKHGIPYEAVQELRQVMGLVYDPQWITPGVSEAAIQTQVRLEATRKGLRLWRNNVGATHTADGGFVRYGLANESEQMNRQIKSSDLIGIRPVLVKSEHVGHTIGQFVAREIKAGPWRYTASTREQAQLRFIELVMSLGGDASFVNREGTL